MENRFMLRSRRWLRPVFALAFAAALGVPGSPLSAQDADAPPAPGDAAVKPAGEPRGADDETTMVELDLPESIELKVLVDLIGRRKDINFIYDRNVLTGKQVTIEAPEKLPSDALIALLESALEMRGLRMFPAKVPGLMRIEVANQQLAQISERITREGEAIDTERTRVAVTRVFSFDHASPQSVQSILQPFLSVPQATVTPLPDLSLLIVTDYASNMQRLEQLIAIVDQPGREVQIRFVEVENVKAPGIVQQVQRLVQSEAQARGGATGGAGPALVADERTNKIAIVGTRADVDKIVALIREFDAPLGLTTEVYRVRFVQPEVIDELVVELIGEVAADRMYSSVVNEDLGVLVATGNRAVHERITGLLKTLDRPAPEEQSPVRFHKLENAKAADVIEVLRNIEGQRGLRDVAVDGVTAASDAEVLRRGPTGESVNPGGLPEQGDPQMATIGGTQLPEARVTADEATNTVIVIADPATQAVYEKLITRLDVRRPQVLVEATIVTLDTSDEFQLGVEILSSEDDVDGGQLLTFSQFGLSAGDVASGGLSIVPGTGFNGALLNADTASVVLRALQADSRARVVSRPNLLINDNEKGRLERNDEEPFASINTIDNVTTESLGGFAEAGTTIEVEPQISEGDHLKLAYSINLSSFTGSATDTLPPARQTNQLESVATIPDGHTIVVGGLTLNETSESVDRVPLLGELPILEYAFSNRRINQSQTTLFVFIRAVILRDDQFEDLKHISMDAARRAELERGYPESEPMLIR